MFPWWRHRAVTSTYFRSAETQKLDKHVLSFCLLQIPHASCSPTSKHFQPTWSPLLTPGQFLSLLTASEINLRQSLSGGSALTFPLGEICVLCIPFLLVSVFKDGWRGPEPMLLHWGSLFLINEFFCLVTKPLTVNLAKRFLSQFELEPWPLIILIFFKVEQNLQNYFSRHIVF